MLADAMRCGPTSAIHTTGNPRALARTIGEMAGALANVPAVDAAEILAVVNVAAWSVVSHLKAGVPA